MILYLHADRISILTGDVQRCGQIPSVTIRWSPCLQQNNAALRVPVLHSAEQRSLSLPVHNVDRRAVLQQQRHAIRMAICRNICCYFVIVAMGWKCFSEAKPPSPRRNGCNWRLMLRRASYFIKNAERKIWRRAVSTDVILTHGRQPQRGRVEWSKLRVDIANTPSQEPPQLLHISTPRCLVQRIVVLPILGVDYETIQLSRQYAGCEHRTIKRVKTRVMRQTGAVGCKNNGWDW